jgi:hypothetical protein
MDVLLSLMHNAVVLFCFILVWLFVEKKFNRYRFVI